MPLRSRQLRIGTSILVAMGVLCLPAHGENRELLAIQFKNYSKFLNDVSVRRSRTVFTPYSVSPFRGVQQCLVHVGDGSAAFSRTDLFVDAPLPIALRRGYVSDRGPSASFGNGWRLTADETITQLDSGGHVYRYGNGRVIKLEGSNGLTPLDRATSYVQELTIDTASGTVSTRAGLLKRFSLYDSVYALESVGDVYGNWIRLVRNARGHIERMVSSNGRSIDLDVDEMGRVHRATESGGSSVVYRYDEYGKLKSFADRRGETWRYAYHAGGQLTEITAPNGLIDIALRYDPSGRIERSTRNGRWCRFDYGSQTSVTDAQGESLYLHHSNGLTSRVVNSIQTTTELGLDRLGRPATLTRNGRLLATLTYRASGAAGGIERYSGSLRGVPIAAHFDTQGRLERYSVGSTNVFSAQYQHGFVPSLVDSDIRRTVVIAHHSDGSLRWVSDELGTDMSFDRDGDSWRIRRINDNRTAKIAFGPTGRIRRVEAWDGSHIEYGFDDAGFRESTVASNGGTVTYHYDAAGSLFHTVAGYEGHAATSFSYIANRRNLVSEVRASSGESHRMLYNAGGQPESFLSPSFPDLKMRYDLLGRLKTIERESMPAITYEYEDGEPDVVLQNDRRSAHASQYLEHPEFGTRFEMTLGRVEVASMGHIRFDEGVKELTLPVATDAWTPATPFTDTLRALELDALLADEPAFWQFSVPSSRFFVPGELWAVNCCWCGCPVNTPYSCDTQ